MTVTPPCKTCPWRVGNDAQDIPNFSLELAEGLAKTCASERGESVSFGEAQFACHQSKDGKEIVCAGWLAVEGDGHIGVRLAVASGKYPAAALVPDEGWGELHTCYAEVIEKLRATA